MRAISHHKRELLQADWFFCTTLSGATGQKTPVSWGMQRKRLRGTQQ